MKKTLAVIGSAAALTMSGAGLAAAQGSSAPAETETPTEISQLAQTLCGTVDAYDYLGSIGSIAPGLEGETCAATAEEAIGLAMTGDISGALDLIRGVSDGTTDPGDGSGEGDGDVDDDDALGSDATSSS